MTPKLFVAAAIMLTASACASNTAPDTPSDGAESPPSGSSLPSESAKNGLHEKQIGELSGWGCPEGVNEACTVAFTVTSIETVKCEYPEIYQLRDGHSVVRIDLDVSTTQELQEDWTNQLSTLFINQWSVVTPDGYSVNNLPDKTGCVPNVDQTEFLLPATKTRPTAIIEIPNDAVELQLRPVGMEDGGGWTWPLEGVIQ